MHVFLVCCMWDAKGKILTEIRVAMEGAEYIFSIVCCDVGQYSVERGQDVMQSK